MATNQIPQIPPITRPTLTTEQMVRQLAVALAESAESSRKAARYHQERLAERPRSSVVKQHLALAKERRDLLDEIAANLNEIARGEMPMLLR